MVFSYRGNSGHFFLEWWQRARSHGLSTLAIYLNLVLTSGMWAEPWSVRCLCVTLQVLIWRMYDPQPVPPSTPAPCCKRCVDVYRTRLRRRCYFCVLTWKDENGSVRDTISTYVEQIGRSSRRFASYYYTTLRSCLHQPVLSLYCTILLLYCTILYHLFSLRKSLQDCKIHMDVEIVSTVHKVTKIFAPSSEGANH